MDAYREKLQSFVYASGTTMKPIFTLAKTAAKKRVAFCEGEEERVLRAAQIVVDEGVARPTLIGRPKIIAQRIEKFGLRLAGRAATTTSSTSSRTTATATSGRPTTA
jgi:malate dehydrogenase (oxaloacetate-decarboxylating)(NADP+)